MQKKLIALAVAGLAAVPAFAQSNVTVYGRADFGYLNRGGQDGGSAIAKNRGEFTSGGQSGSRIGFRGAEDLGNGLKAIFEVEFGMNIDQTAAAGSSNATWTNRHSYVGLTGGFGTVVGGRLDGVRYGVFGAYDPFGAGTVGNFAQITTQYDRANNAIAYLSPKWNGLGLVLAYATHTGGPEGSNVSRFCGAANNTCNGNEGDDQLQTIMVTYDNGPLSAKLDYETTRLKNVESSHLHVATAGASYNFGVAKVSAIYDVIQGAPRSNIGTTRVGQAATVATATTPALGATTAVPAGQGYDRRNWLVGVSVPFGKFTGKASYGVVNDKDPRAGVDQDAKKWAIGADYALSKRTNLYANYSRINNDSTATHTLAQGANTNSAGYGVRGFDLGIAHNF